MVGDGVVSVAGAGYGGDGGNGTCPLLGQNPRVGLV